MLNRKEINQLLEKRKDLRRQIMDAKHQLRGAEATVVDLLMEAGRSDLFTVNWRRVEREMDRG